MQTTKTSRRAATYTAPAVDHAADVYATWSVDEGADIADYRIVRHRTLWPRRIDGRWRRPGTACYALQMMYRYENPPTLWVTLRCALDPATLAR
jgi:hypothetical protein